LPWRQKLPMEAAAVVLVGVMAVILFKATPELQRAARVEPPTEAPRREARPVTPVPVAPSAPPRDEPPAIVAEAERDATRPRDLARARRAPRRDPRGASDHRVAGHRPAPRPETGPRASGTSPALPCLTEQTPNPAGQEERSMQTRPIALMLLVALTATDALAATPRAVTHHDQLEI